MSYREVKKCRACGSAPLKPVFDMGNHPLANDHCSPGEPRQGFYPLCVLFCHKCGLAQLSAVVDRELIYRKYSYVSSRSEIMMRHYDRLFLDILSEQPEKKIVEIASNDGGCLEFAQKKGFEVFGIDPARNLAAIAESHGIPTKPEFFGTSSVMVTKDKLGQPGVVLARHVLAHIDDWGEFFKSLELLCDVNTLVVFEFPYVLDLLQKGSWDTIYHEHLSMINLNAMVHVLKPTKFHIHRIIKVGVHGGALVMMLRHNDSPVMRHLSADEMIAEERITEDDWKKFKEEADQKVACLKSMVSELKDQGNIISIFGASAKTTVLCRMCDFDYDKIEFCTDNSPFKPGRLIPGTKIPIIEEERMLSEHPDVAILGAWNYASEIMEKMKRYRERGGKFLIPDSQLRLV